MNAGTGLPFLRPHLFKDVSVVSRFAYIRFYNSTKCWAHPAVLPRRKDFNETCGSLETRRYKSSLKPLPIAPISSDSQVAQRVKALQSVEALNYPRIAFSSDAVSIKEYISSYKHLKTAEKQTILTVRGRLNLFL